MDDPSFSPGDLMEVVSKRADFVDALADRPAEKRDLVDRVGVSRSTVNRAIWDLEEAGLVEDADGEYRLTVSGRLLHEQYDRYEAEATAIAAANGLLQYLPQSTLINVDFLRGADVFTVADPAPHVPATVLTEVIGDAESVRGVSRSHAAPTVDEALRDVVARGGTIEVVFRDGVFDQIRSMYDWVTDRVASGDYRPHVVDDLPYGLVIAEQAAKQPAASEPSSADTPADRTVYCLVVHDERESLAGIIVNDTDVAVEWATDVFERYRSEAASVTARDEE